MIEVLSRFCRCVERASIDEAFLDLTQEVEERLRMERTITPTDIPNTHVIGWEPTGEDSTDKGKVKLIHYTIFLQ